MRFSPLRVFFFCATIFLFACAKPIRNVNEDLLSEDNVTVYSGKFLYTLSDCHGPGKEVFEKKSKERKERLFIIEMEGNKIRLMRPNFVAEILATVKASWNPTDGSLSRIRGGFGVAEKENWRKSRGAMVLEGQSLKGTIENISVVQAKTWCRMMLQFSGVI